MYTISSIANFYNDDHIWYQYDKKQKARGNKEWES